MAAAPAGAKAHQAPAAHSRFSAMHSPAVRASPMAGTSQNAAASTPSTAPPVLQAYSAAMDRLAAACAPRRHCRLMRSIAGKVAPMAAVAGSSSKNVPQKATDHCQAGLG